MDLFELLVSLTARASLIQIREDILVVAGITNSQGAALSRAPVKNSAITNATLRRTRTRFPATHFACVFCVGMPL